MNFVQDFRYGAYPASRAFSLAWRLTAFTTLASLVSHVVGLFYIPRSKYHIGFSGERMTIYRRYKKIQRFIRIHVHISRYIATDEANGNRGTHDQFVVKCIIIPPLMKINVIKASSSVFQCCWENIICSFFPARHTRNFPASWIKLVGFPASWSNLFPSQELN